MWPEQGRGTVRACYSASTALVIRWIKLKSEDMLIVQQQLIIILFLSLSFVAVLWEGVARGVLMTNALPPPGAPAPWAPPHSGAAPPPIWATPWPGGRGRNWATPSPPYSGPSSPLTKIRTSQPTSSPSPRSSDRQSSARWAESAVLEGELGENKALQKYFTLSATSCISCIN